MRRGEQDLPFKVIVWNLALAGVLLGAVGYSSDRKVPLALAVLCLGLVFLTSSVEGVMTGQFRGRRQTYDSDDNPILFWLAALINFGISAAVLGYAMMLLTGQADLTADDVNRHFRRFWHRRR